MNIQFTFKHMESSKPLIDLAEEKFSSRIERFTSSPLHAHVTFSVQGLIQKIHVTLLTADGHNIEAEHEGIDMYAEIDVVAEKIEVQLRRHKEKLKSHKGASVRDLAQANSLSSTTEEDDQSFIREEEESGLENAIDAGDILNFEKATHKPLTPVCG